MRIAIMQPYFMPYLGYWQLMHAVDVFVVYDNIKYTKKGWINRNYINNFGKIEGFTVPIKSGSDSLDICERRLSSNYLEINYRTLRKIELFYQKSPFYKQVIPLVQKIFLFEPNEKSLFDFVFNSIVEVKNFLNINVELLISSMVPGDIRALKGENRVINICLKKGAKQYINPIGGISLYNSNHFKQMGISLLFHKMNAINYSQQNEYFLANLSMIDVLMFNGREGTRELLACYRLEDKEALYKV
jgi:hypothetical protein